MKTFYPGKNSMPFTILSVLVIALAVLVLVLIVSLTRVEASATWYRANCEAYERMNNLTSAQVDSNIPKEDVR